MTQQPSKRLKKPDRSRPGWRGKAYTVIRRLADSPLPAIAFISTFVLSRWWSNSDFSYPQEILVPIALFAVLICVIFYGYRWILGRGLAAHLATLILSWSLYSYSHFLGTAIGKWL